MVVSSVSLLLVLLVAFANCSQLHRIKRDVVSYLENEIQKDALPSDVLGTIRVKKSPEEEKMVKIKSADQLVDKSKTEKRDTLSEPTKLTDVDVKDSKDNSVTDAEKKVDRKRRQHIIVPGFSNRMVLMSQPNSYLYPSVNARTVAVQRPSLLQVDRNGFSGGVKDAAVDVSPPLFAASVQTDGQSLPIQLPGFQLSTGVYSGGVPPQLNSYPPNQPGNSYPPYQPGNSYPPYQPGNSYPPAHLPPHASFPLPYGSPLLPPSGYVYQPSPYLCSCYPPPHPPQSPHPPQPPHYQGRSAEKLGDDLKYSFLFNTPTRNIMSRADTVLQNTLPECALEFLANLTPEKSVIEGLVNLEDQKLKRIEECAKKNSLSKSDYDTLMQLVNKEINQLHNQVKQFPQQSQYQLKKT